MGYLLMMVGCLDEPIEACERGRRLGKSPERRVKLGVTSRVQLAVRAFGGSVPRAR